MKFTQIRNATSIVEYAGLKFLIDPWLGPKDYLPGFEIGVHSERRQPRVELPWPIDKIVDVDAVIITHLHPDHWDEAAEKAISRAKKIFVQSESDKYYLEQRVFINVEVISPEGTTWNGVTLYKAPCLHGMSEFPAMGVVFTSKSDKTFYLAGDTIWYEGVKNTIAKFKPFAIAVNACAATLVTGLRLIMDDKDIEEIFKDDPGIIVIATHLDTVSHATVSRDDLEKLKKEHHYTNLLIPADGETLTL